MKLMKKIAPFAASLLMLGATAAAADLATWKSSFPGADTAIVVGAASTVDTIGAVDLTAALTVTSTSGTGSTKVAGDAYKIKESSDLLEIGESLNGVTDVITDDDLEALKSGKISNDKGTFEYNQYIETPDATAYFTTDPDDDEDMPNEYLVFNGGSDAYIYKVEFPTALEARSDYLDKDLEDKKLTLLNKEYTIVSVENTAGNANLALTLMGGALEQTITEMDPKATLTFGGKSFDVELVLIGEDPKTASFNINGEITGPLEEGETYKLDDGTEIGIRDIVYRGENRGYATFYMGVEKFVLEDTDIETDGIGEQELEVGTNALQDTEVKIIGTDDGDTLKISTIQIKWTPDDDLYIAKDGKLTDKEDDDEEGQVFGNMDFQFQGFDYGNTEEIKLTDKGDDEYILTFTTNAGQTVNLPLYDMDVALRFGDEDYNTVLVEGAATTDDISKNDYFVVTSGKSTYALQYKGYDEDDEVLSFKNLGNGNTFTVSTDGTDGQIILGGKYFDVYLDDGLTGDTDISVDLDDSGAIDSGAPSIFTKLGAEIVVDTLGNSFDIITEDLDDSNTPETITVTIDDGTADEIDVASIESDTLVSDLMLDVGDSDNMKGVSAYGIQVSQTGDTSGPDTFKMLYPDSQAEVEVYVTTGEVTFASSTSGTSSGIAPIAVMDDQIDNVKTKNIIAIGGSAINRVAAELLGLSYPTYGTDSAWTAATGVDGAGKAVIKLMNSTYTTGKYAMLVAGWEGTDTTRAAKALREGTPALAGMSTTLNTATSTVTVLSS